MYPRVVLPLIAAILFMGPAAFAAEPKNESSVMRELLDEIRQLKARVGELEARLPAQAVTASVGTPVIAAPVVAAALVDASLPAPVAASLPAPVAASPAAPVAMQHEAVEPEPDNPHENHYAISSPSLSFHGYADIGARAITANGGTNTFRLGQADLFVTSKLSDNLSFLMETTLDSDLNNVPGIEIERILLTYRKNEYLNVSAGRYHSAIGYFNGAFHHGRWFQTAADRPFLFEFEDGGGILPIHNVGASFYGRVPSGNLRLNYVFEVGNGRAYRQDAPTVQTSTSARNGKSVNLALYASPHSTPGWQFGASMYRNGVAPDGIHNIDQKIYSAHAVYVRDRVEFLNEGVLMRNTGTLGSRVTDVPGFYSQLAYRIGSASRPYFRYEYLNAAASDPVVGPLLGNAGHRQGMTAGYRYDLAEFCAIKFQLERVRRRALGSSTEGAVQLSFAF